MAKEIPYSPEVNTLYQSMQSQGYKGTIQTIVNLAVAEAVIRHPECQVDEEVVEWARRFTGT